MRLRNPALDGLRGVAVLAVVCFHAGAPWLPGGWLGVDVFFVLSGFLITSILIEEFGRTRRCDLRRFWARRVRRLLPAALLCCAALAVIANLDDRVLKYRTLRADAFASLASVVNWRFATSGEAYFDRFAAPSLLRHFWSLSVEVQFYAVWPVLLLVLLLLPGRWTAACVTILLAGASAVAMAVFAAHEDRAYFGTDTHAHGLLLGAAAALVCSRCEMRGRVVQLAGVAAAAGVVVAFVTLRGTDPVALRGGIFAVAVAATIVVVALGAADARGPLVAALSSRPLRALGVLSFGIYLWHWPLLQILDDRPVVVPLAATLLAAIVSYYGFERPVLRGWPRARPARPLAIASAATTVVMLVALAPTVAPPQARAEAVAAARSVTARSPVARPEPARRAVVLVVGDSVAESMLPGLVAHEATAGLVFLNATAQGCTFDARATEYSGGGSNLDAADLVRPKSCDWGTTWPQIIRRARPDGVFMFWGHWDALDRRVDGKWLRVGTGAWATDTEQLFERSLAILTAHGAHVVLGTMPEVVGVAHWRTAAFNDLLRRVAARHPGVVGLIETHAEMIDPDVVRWDGVHLTAAGAGVLAASVVPQLAAQIPVPRGTGTGTIDSRPDVKPVAADRAAPGPG